MDRRDCQATVQGVAKSQTRLRTFTISIKIECICSFKFILLELFTKTLRIDLFNWRLMLYNVVLISAVKQHESVISIHISDWLSKRPHIQEILNKNLPLDSTKMPTSLGRFLSSPWNILSSLHLPGVSYPVQLCDPTDGSPPGSHLPGIFQARILEWAAFSFFNVCIHTC